eukprot:2688561-Rhodomonas_salina.4
MVHPGCGRRSACDIRVAARGRALRVDGAWVEGSRALAAHRPLLPHHRADRPVPAAPRHALPLPRDRRRHVSPHPLQTRRHANRLPGRRPARDDGPCRLRRPPRRPDPHQHPLALARGRARRPAAVRRALGARRCRPRRADPTARGSDAAAQVRGEQA